jgi:hypothetical protein
VLRSPEVPHYGCRLLVHDQQPVAVTQGVRGQHGHRTLCPLNVLCSDCINIGIGINCGVGNTRLSYWIPWLDLSMMVVLLIISCTVTA